MHFALKGYIHTRFGQSAGVLQGIRAATSNKNNQWYKGDQIYIEYLYLKEVNLKILWKMTYCSWL